MARRDRDRDIEIHDPEADAAPRDGLGNALIIVTTLLLLGAFITIQLAMKQHFGTGMFGESSSTSTTR